MALPENDGSYERRGRDTHQGADAQPAPPHHIRIASRFPLLDRDLLTLVRMFRRTFDPSFPPAGRVAPANL